MESAQTIQYAIQYNKMPTQQLIAVEHLVAKNGWLASNRGMCAKEEFIMHIRGPSVSLLYRMENVCVWHPYVDSIC